MRNNHRGNTKIPTCAVHQGGTGFNGGHPGITSFNRAITINDIRNIDCGLRLHGCLLTVWLSTVSRQQVFTVWYIIGSVNSTCRTNGIAPMTMKYNQMSCVVRKLVFCICENNVADQLRGNREADQRLCFRYMDSTIPLLSESEISSL